jgi:hypothetical protein
MVFEKCTGRSAEQGAGQAESSSALDASSAGREATPADANTSGLPDEATEETGQEATGVSAASMEGVVADVIDGGLVGTAGIAEEDKMLPALMRQVCFQQCHLLAKNTSHSSSYPSLPAWDPYC